MRHVFLTIIIGYSIAVAIVCTFLYWDVISIFMYTHVILVAIVVAILGFAVAIYCFRMYSHRFDAFCYGLWRRVVK